MSAPETSRLEVNLEEAELHTEEMQDIIAAPPAWLIRWGISVFLFVLLSVLATSIFIRYPDTIKASLIVNSNTVSKSITAGSTGQLTTLLVKSGQLVNPGQTIAYIGNNADHRQVLTLLADLSTIRNDLFNGKVISDNVFNNINVNSLGELQQGYENFYLSYKANQSAIKNRNWEKLSFFIQDMNKLTSEVLAWKNKYILIATQLGNIHFTQSLRQSQTVTAGQELFYISAGASHYFGEVMLPQSNINKIKVGQQVIVGVNQLPAEKYGVIKGRISTISELPLNNGNYLVKVNFLESDKGLINSPNLRAHMLANAEIITDNVTLFQRLTSGLFKKTADKF
jgi:HlyD family secretion protein